MIKTKKTIYWTLEILVFFLLSSHFLFSNQSKLIQIKQDLFSLYHIKTLVESSYVSISMIDETNGTTAYKNYPRLNPVLMKELHFSNELDPSCGSKSVIFGNEPLSIKEEFKTHCYFSSISKKKEYFIIKKDFINVMISILKKQRNEF